MTKPLSLSLPILTVVAALTGQASAQQEPEITRFDGAQHLTCQRVDNGKVVLDRELVFYLVRARAGITEEYAYRDGRAGARKMNFRINRNIVTCAASPVQGDAANPVTEFEGVYQIACSDSGRQMIRPMYVKNLVERGTDTAIVYEFDIIDGPPRRQKFMLSAAESDCMVRFVRDSDPAPETTQDEG